MSILEVRSITKNYDEFSAVDNVSFQVPKGEVYALLGHNGAGKSTLIKMILGLVNPSDGEIVINGSTYLQDPLGIKMKVGYLPERMNFYDNLTAWETLRFYARVKGIGEERCSKVLTEVGLEQAMHKKVGAFSKGMQQRLGLAQAIIHKPQLLILDEPTTGLDPSGVLWLKEMIRSWHAAGTTIFFSSHNLGDVEELARRVAIMRHGQLVAGGTIAELQAEYHLKVTLQLQLAAAMSEDQFRHMEVNDWYCKVSGNHLTVVCNPNQKGQVMESVVNQGIRFNDFSVEEPGLAHIYQAAMKQTATE
jgi:ABC-2 type transport system ATP-binding protein/Cu-processing system ATP-binding protein